MFNKLHFLLIIFLNRHAFIIKVLLYVCIYLCFFDPFVSFCMTNDNIEDNISEISEVFEYDNNFIDYSLSGYLSHDLPYYEHQFSSKYNETEYNNLSEIEKNIGIAFEYYADNNPSSLIKDPSLYAFDEKAKIIKDMFFENDRLKSIYLDGVHQQTEHLYRRQTSLIEAKQTIKQLQEEKEELTRLLKDSLK